MTKVITYGTFDLLHYGHINLLKRAKALGDYLVVGVTSENYDRYRGKLNVQQPLAKRIKNVLDTGLADEVVVEEYEGQKIDDIARLHVDIFAIGSDWIGRFDYLKEYCQVVYLERTRGISSTELRERQHSQIRLGVVGTGRIANRFIPESKFVSGVTVEGVYNPHGDSAANFAQKYELAFHTDDYDKFLEQVTAVYIASPHETHYAYTERALRTGKHVLCEKPMVFTQSEAEQLFEIAHEHNVILMEAIKTAYCPGFRRMVSCAKSGKIGRIVSVDATFTKLVPPHVREMQDSETGGSVTELATYPLLAILQLLGSGYEHARFYSLFDKKTGVDLFTQIHFQYPETLATAKVGLGVKSEGSLVIAGTRGYIYVPAPWWKTEYFELRFENPNEVEKNFYKFAEEGLRYELTEFLTRITERKMDEGACKLSVDIARIIEEYRRGHAVEIGP